MHTQLLTKAGVDISRLTRNTRRGLHSVWAVLSLHKEYTIITSTYEGDHSAGSLHYANQAFDVRKPIKNRAKILRTIKKGLGKKWDVIAEGTHWHFEYDPK